MKYIPYIDLYVVRWFKGFFMYFLYINFLKKISLFFVALFLPLMVLSACAPKNNGFSVPDERPERRGSY